MLAKCQRRCWDSQKTRRYYIGDVADLPEDHVFLTMKNPCFIPLSAKDIADSRQDPNSKIEQLARMIEEKKKDDPPIPEMKRPVGRPPKSGD